MSPAEWMSLALAAIAFVTGQAWLVGRVISARFARIEGDSKVALHALRHELHERQERLDVALKSHGVDHTRLATQVAVMSASLPTFERMEALMDRSLQSVQDRMDERMRGLERRIDSLGEMMSRGRRPHEDNGA